MPKLNLEITLNNSGHVILCNVSGSLSQSGDGWNEPRELELEDFSVDSMTWDNTGREVKMKSIFNKVSELAEQAFLDYDFDADHDDDPRGGDGPDD